MANVLDEIESYVVYLSSLFPEATIERQNVPTNPSSKTFTVKVSRSDSEQVQDYTFLTRTISIVYVGDDDLDIFDTVEKIRVDLQNKKRSIPLYNSDFNILRVTSFGYSEPFDYEDGIHRGVILVLTSQSQELIKRDSDELIQHVNAKFN